MKLWTTTMNNNNNKWSYFGKMIQMIPITITVIVHAKCLVSVELPGE